MLLRQWTLMRCAGHCQWLLWTHKLLSFHIQCSLSLSPWSQPSSWTSNRLTSLLGLAPPVWEILDLSLTMLGLFNLLASLSLHFFKNLYFSLGANVVQCSLIAAICSATWLTEELRLISLSEKFSMNLSKSASVALLFLVNICDINSHVVVAMPKTTFHSEKYFCALWSHNEPIGLNSYRGVLFTQRWKLIFFWWWQVYNQYVKMGVPLSINKTWIIKITNWIQLVNTRRAGMSQTPEFSQVNIWWSWGIYCTQFVLQNWLSLQIH